MKVKTALLSVTDKSGLEHFARQLYALGVELIATGGTYKKISEAKVPVKKMEEITRFPEMLDGRVKTLQPEIHAGILADREKKEHMQVLKGRGIKPIDLVVVNLYQFKETVRKKGISLEDAMENIDIGGPTMVRAAAKNYRGVAIVTFPGQYDAIIDELRKNNCCLSLRTREKLAAKAFEETAAYDSTISHFLHNKFIGKQHFPEKLSLTFEKAQDLRYGENWHQKAAFYREPLAAKSSVALAKQLHGKELSFNNINDANAAIELAKEFNEPSAVIIKHANPCGTASDSRLSVAFKKALECDKTSAFGGIITLNRKCDAPTAEQVASFFNEIVIAPSFDSKALEILKKKRDLRVLQLPGIEKPHAMRGIDFRAVEGGALVQTLDSHRLKESDCKLVSKRKPTVGEMQDLLFAWSVAKYAKSNAIVLAKNKATVGVGAGQMSRIDSTEIAVKKSAGRCKGSVLASDAFFPFRDNVDLAAKAGITAIIQPGGSVKDKEVIAAADQHGIAMVFTGVRHFRH
ncbi:MAG: bifunctional phosphoribosylaminoimidazolecarboxamide formyltransferase/IMP cyclohydrolase [Candidatus Diapherotrites archaeon]|nr:bifunctional phosphoribosylaminoimidazolecarboxamide formyltransferase/IMP cyclohydrolase [Candidatus Diapherotrites archaeon]